MALTPSNSVSWKIGSNILFLTNVFELLYGPSFSITGLSCPFYLCIKRKKEKEVVRELVLRASFTASLKSCDDVKIQLKYKFQTEEHLVTCRLVDADNFCIEYYLLDIQPKDLLEITCTFINVQLSPWNDQKTGLFKNSSFKLSGTSNGNSFSGAGSFSSGGGSLAQSGFSSFQQTPTQQSGVLKNSSVKSLGAANGNSSSGSFNFGNGAGPSQQTPTQQSGVFENSSVKSFGAANGNSSSGTFTFGSGGGPVITSDFSCSQQTPTQQSGIGATAGSSRFDSFDRCHAISLGTTAGTGFSRVSGSQLPSQMTQQKANQLHSPLGSVTDSGRGSIDMMHSRKRLTAPQSLNEGSSVNLNLGEIALSRCLKEVFLDEEDSDVILKVGEEKYPAHKVIIKARSPVFRAELTHNMREKNEGVIHVQDCDPHVFRDFLLYLYTGKLDNMSKGNAFELYRISDIYDVKELKENCIDFILSNLSIDTICDAVSLAARHSEHEMLTRATEFFTKNAKSIVTTVEWQKFVREHPVEANELFIKTLNKDTQK